VLHDYLGMGQHPKVTSAMGRDRDPHGSGGGRHRTSPEPTIRWSSSSASSPISRQAAALVFTSAMSQYGGISTIAKLMPNCLILSDASNHNSMIEGIRQSGSEKQIWRHNDVAHLEALALRHRTQIAPS